MQIQSLDDYEITLLENLQKQLSATRKNIETNGLSDTKQGLEQGVVNYLFKYRAEKNKLIKTLNDLENILRIGLRWENGMSSKEWDIHNNFQNTLIETIDGFKTDNEIVNTAATTHLNEVKKTLASLRNFKAFHAATGAQYEIQNEKLTLKNCEADFLDWLANLNLEKSGDNTERFQKNLQGCSLGYWLLTPTTDQYGDASNQFFKDLTNLYLRLDDDPKNELLTQLKKINHYNLSAFEIFKDTIAIKHYDQLDKIKQWEKEITTATSTNSVSTETNLDHSTYVSPTDVAMSKQTITSSAKQVGLSAYQQILSPPSAPPEDKNELKDTPPPSYDLSISKTKVSVQTNANNNTSSIYAGNNQQVLFSQPSLSPEYAISNQLKNLPAIPQHPLPNTQNVQQENTGQQEKKGILASS